MNREVLLVDFKLEDLNHMQIKMDEIGDLGDFNERLKKVMCIGESKTIYYSDEILGVMGYFELWSGVCEIWVIPSGKLEHKGVLALVLKDALNKLFNTEKFHRMQATVKNDGSNHIFMKKLGFESEGTLKRYSTSKQDYNMWSKVK